MVYPLKFSYQCIVKQNSYLRCTIADILIFFGCLSFVVVVVFDLSKICIQLLPFCVVLLFLLLIIINLMYIITIQHEFRLQYYLSKHHF